MPFCHRTPTLLPALLLAGLLATSAPLHAQWTLFGTEADLRVDDLALRNDTLYAATVEGLLRTPLDGNGSWETLELPGTPTRISHVAAFGTSSLAVVAERAPLSNIFETAPYLALSHDHGASWDTVTVDFFSGIAAVPGGDTLYASCTLPMGVQRSVDGGQSWQWLWGDTDSFGMGTHFVELHPGSPGVMRSGGENGFFQPYLLERMPADTLHFQLLDVNGDNAVYSMLMKPDDPEDFVIGTEGYLLRTTDGGDAFSSYTVSNYSYIYGLAHDPAYPERIYAVGAENAASNRFNLYVSSDGGSSWEERISGEDAPGNGFTSLAVSREGGEVVLYAGSYGAGIRRYLDATAEVPGEPGAPGPTSFTLSPAAPNPFNGATRLLLQLSTPARVAVSVHDLLGRRVAILHRGELAAGRHRLSWEGTAGGGEPLPSGLYIVRAKGEGHSLARKVLLLR